MSLYFLINNLGFAFGMIGFITLLIAAWLSYDAYRLQRDAPVLLRSIGFVLFAVWRLIDAVNINNDILSYIALIILLAGLVLLVGSFLATKKLALNAVIVIPAFSAFGSHAYVLSAILLVSISYFSLRQWKREYNRTWIPFSVAFLLFGIASFLGSLGGAETGFSYILGHLIELAGSAFLAVWVWQYMRLRISESFVMISFGVTFILATIITLAFSTILIGRVSTDTSANLLTDVKALGLSIDSLKEESLAKAELAATDPGFADAIAKGDTISLDQLSQRLLDQYNLGFLTVTDDQGVVLVRAHALARAGDSLAGERAFEEAVLQNPIATIEDSSVEGFSIRAGAPIISKNKVVGAIIAGFPLDNVFADRLKKLTGLEMLVYKNDTSVASTLFDVDGVTRLVGAPLSDQAVTDTTIAHDTAFTGPTMINGRPFYASFLPLTNSDGKVVGMISAAESEQNIVDIANATNQLTLITVVLIMAILLLPIYMVSKRLNKNIS